MMDRWSDGGTVSLFSTYPSTLSSLSTQSICLVYSSIHPYIHTYIHIRAFIRLNVAITDMLTCGGQAIRGTDGTRHARGWHAYGARAAVWGLAGKPPCAAARTARRRLVRKRPAKGPGAYVSARMLTHCSLVLAVSACMNLSLAKLPSEK